MFGWLKNKVGVSTDGAAAALRAQFQPLEQLPGTRFGLAKQLADFVLTGKGEGVVSSLSAILGKLAVPSLMYTTAPEQDGLHLLVPRLPQDPEILLRLAKVHDVVRQSGRGVSVILWGAPIIPAFQGSVSWLGTFLIELSENGKQKEPTFSTGLVLAMIEASGENPNVLMRGPFFYEDSQGKNQLTRWNLEPFTCFHCLDQFEAFVLSAPDEIRAAFKQKQAGSRAAVLHALSKLQISPEPFAEEIAALGVSGSKEVRENAAPLILQQFSLFKSRWSATPKREARTNAFRRCVCLFASAATLNVSFLRSV